MLRYRSGEVFDNGPNAFPFIIQFIRSGIFRKRELDLEAALHRLPHAEAVEDLAKGWELRWGPPEDASSPERVLQDRGQEGWVPIVTDVRIVEQGYPQQPQGVWYRRAIRAPQRLPGQRIFLYLSGVDGTVTVFANGKQVATHSAKVQDAGLTNPFYLDLTRHLVEGENRIHLWVRKRTGTTGISGGVNLLRAAAARAPVRG